MWIVESQKLTKHCKGFESLNTFLGSLTLSKVFFFLKLTFTQKKKKDIEKVRSQELKDFIMLRIAWMVFSVISFGGGVIVSFATFSVYTIVQGEILDPATAFVWLQ